MQPPPGQRLAHAPADEGRPSSRLGSNVKLLVSNVLHIEPIHAMARMTGIPFNLRQLYAATA